MASVCTARLLTDAGVPCVLDLNCRPKLAAILLSAQTEHLLRGLFPATENGQEDIFSGFARVTRRIVGWGGDRVEADLPHQGMVAPEGELLRRLWRRVPSLPICDGSRSESWRIESSREGIDSAQERCIGSRNAWIASVDLSTEAELEACWVEAVQDGWLFMLSRGEGRATLIAAGDTVENLLLQSRLVARRVAKWVRQSGSIPIHPRLRQGMARDRSIYCGAAAMSFDPLCGEGAGNAIREAFLVAAVVRAEIGGADRERLTAHYDTRLRQGFLRHLQTCLPFYETGGMSRSWKDSCDELRAGIEDLLLELASAPRPFFRLVDRDLVAL